MECPRQEIASRLSRPGSVRIPGPSLGAPLSESSGLLSLVHSPCPFPSMVRPPPGRVASGETARPPSLLRSPASRCSIPPRERDPRERPAAGSRRRPCKKCAKMGPLYRTNLGRDSRDRKTRCLDPGFLSRLSRETSETEKPAVSIPDSCLVCLGLFWWGHSPEHDKKSVSL